MAPKAKQAITLEKLVEIGKATLKEPNPVEYLHEDVDVVVAQHHAFFMAVAPLTKRLNPVSMGLAIKDLHRLSPRDCKLWGEGMSHAYSHCMLAGNKSITGSKLSAEVFAVWKAANPTTVKTGPVKQELASSTGRVKAEPAVKAESSSAAAAVKRELGSASSSGIQALYSSQPAAPPAKALKKCLSDPADIQALYSSSKPKVKVCALGGRGGEGGSNDCLLFTCVLVVCVNPTCIGGICMPPETDVFV